MKLATVSEIKIAEFDDWVLAPSKYIPDITRTPERFCRDIANIPTTSITPFFRLKYKIKEAVKNDLFNPFLEESVSLHEDWVVNDGFARYIHIDLAKNRDRAGICCVHAPFFREVMRRDQKTDNESIIPAPHIVVDFMGTVEAPLDGEIQLIDFVHLVEDVEMRGAYVNLVTFDIYQSVQPIQMLRDAGFTAGVVSIDRTTHGIIVNSKCKFNLQKESTNGDYSAAMDCMRIAMYEDRLVVPYHSLWEKECEEMEWIQDKSIAEKNAGGSDDLIQPVAGAAFACTLNEFDFTEAPRKPMTDEQRVTKAREENFRNLEREHYREVNDGINDYRKGEGYGGKRNRNDWENGY